MNAAHLSPNVARIFRAHDPASGGAAHRTDRRGGPRGGRPVPRGPGGASRGARAPARSLFPRRDRDRAHAERRARARHRPRAVPLRGRLVQARRCATGVAEGAAVSPEIAASPDGTAVRVALWRALHVEVDPPRADHADAGGDPDEGLTRAAASRSSRLASSLSAGSDGPAQGKARVRRVVHEPRKPLVPGVGLEIAPQRRG